MIAYLVSILLYIVPILLLLYMMIEIYQRNRYNGLNKIAACFFLATMLFFIGNLLFSIAPIQYAGRIALLLFYFPACIIMCLTMHFCFRLTEGFQSTPRPVMTAICYSPLVPASLVFFPPPWITVHFVQNGIWKYQEPGAGLTALMLGSTLYTAVVCIVIVTAGFRFVNQYDLNLKRKQMRTVLLGLLFSFVWAIAFIFFKMPAVMPSGVNFPALSSFALIIFTFFLRYAMIKYDFLPSLERKYQALYEMSPLTMIITDQDGIIKEANPQAALLFECTQKELLLRHAQEFIFPQSHKSSRSFDQPGFGEETIQGDYIVVTRKGAKKYVKAESKYFEAQGDLLQYVVLLDVTKAKAAEEQAVYLAYHDTLTGLMNRAHFNNELESHLSEGSRSSIAIMLLDLDGFKQINDTQGHVVGDHLLKKVADQLSLLAPPQATIFRLGGDEFALIIPGLKDKEQIHGWANQILAGFKMPFAYQDKAFYVTSSMGICWSPEHGVNPDELLQFADIAMYQAKRQGRNQFVMYEPQLHDEEQGRYLINSGVRQGLEEGEFSLHYQPQIDVRTGAVMGVEALIRWNRPGIGFVPPGDFIPLAEESGIIVEIGYWVLDTACLQLQRWLEAGIAPFSMSINLSARQFLDPNFSRRLTDTLHRTGIDPSLLCLEITENTAMSDSENVTNICSEIMNLGVKLSIDDFGTGYSSLSLLKRLSVHSIKIDRSFVKDMLESEHDRAIINAIIAMSHSLGKRVVAEGVEEQGQWDMLSGLGCDEIQGYYISRPLAAGDLVGFLSKNKVGV